MYPVVGELATVYVVGLVGTFVALQSRSTSTGLIGDVVAPFLYAGIAAFWPVIVAGSLAHAVVDAGTWIVRR